jgi:very-short-patch-repair endonuclease
VELRPPHQKKILFARKNFKPQEGKTTALSNFQPMNEKYDNYNYNKKLQPYANRLRKTMTKAEACLWKYVLKARQLRGYQFRRQRPVLWYIADFMCKKLMLVIEVDGLSHTWEETIRKDKKKNCRSCSGWLYRTALY